MKHTVALSNPTSPGAKLGSKIEPRSLKNDDEKNDEKTKGDKMGNKSQQEAPASRGEGGLGSMGGGRGEVNSSPEN